MPRSTHILSFDPFVRMRNAHNIVSALRAFSRTRACPSRLCLEPGTAGRARLGPNAIERSLAALVTFKQRVYDSSEVMFVYIFSDNDTPPPFAPALCGDGQSASSASPPAALVGQLPERAEQAACPPAVALPLHRSPSSQSRRTHILKLTTLHYTHTQSIRQYEPGSESHPPSRCRRPLHRPPACVARPHRSQPGVSADS